MASSQPAGATAARPAVTLERESRDAGFPIERAGSMGRASVRCSGSGMGPDTSEGTLDAPGLGGEPVDRR